MSCLTCVSQRTYDGGKSPPAMLTMKTAPIRIIQGIAVLSAVMALALSSWLVRIITPVCAMRIHEYRGGRPLPGLTVFALAHGVDAWMYETTVALAVLAAAVFIWKRSPTPDAASTRLLLPVTIGWVVAFLVGATAAVAWTLPFIPDLIRMDQTEL